MKDATLGGITPLGTILIVDDTPTSATALELACAGIRGVHVRTVSSALEAVRILQREDGPVCAVITDLRMPVMDGFQLVEFMRAHSRHAATPVVVVTADTDPDTPERMARLGADAYFAKPFSPGAVRQTVERLLHANQTSK
jgi:two-component system chemotaxis response regulator CheY